MTTDDTGSFRSFLRGEIGAILRRKVTPAPLLLWCDPDRSWRDLLRSAAEGGAFELWSDDEHELVLRERLLLAPSVPRVVWLPIDIAAISYLKVFELQAEQVWNESLIAALARFGVPIARDQELSMRDLLRAQAKEWIDRPRSDWKELTPGNAKLALVDDEQILTVLATPKVAVATLIDSERTKVFSRRVTEDFGLPLPVPGKDDEWRAAAMAYLLTTEVASLVPAELPGDAERVIPAGAVRKRALKLLQDWRNHVERQGSFEETARRADGITSLVFWAKNVMGRVPALSSRAAEDVLFQREVDLLAPLEDVDQLARRLEEGERYYALHAEGFWGKRAEHKIAWASLATLAHAAVALRAQDGVEKAWKTPEEAVHWFTTVGWEVDQQGENLFREDPSLPGGLHGVRARLRRAYLRHVDRVSSAFSELLHHHGVDAMKLDFAGEVLARARPAKDPAAVIVIDACRFDLGKRLAEALNKGEPARRAEVLAARAPLPSITALGMPFALADDAGELTVELTKEARWRVSARGESHDLTVAEARREWLRRRFKLKQASITDTKTVLDAPPPSPKDTGKLLFVFGDEFDTQGHEGELLFTGADDHVERYGRVVRRLRDAGYSTVLVVTDHGFIHWEPEKDEVDPQPTGDLRWKSRRAIAGNELAHATALKVGVKGGDVECSIPRSINAFQTYGRIGFFHGGATLQELVIPVVVVRWPKKAEKIAVVLTPLLAVTSLKPRVEVRPGGSGHLPGLGTNEKMMGRAVCVHIVEVTSRRRIFTSAVSQIEPDALPTPVTLEPMKGETCSRGTKLRVEVQDEDNGELLDSCEVELKVDLEDWD